jgi:hypothetical protein
MFLNTSTESAPDCVQSAAELSCPVAIRAVLDPVGLITESMNLKLDDWQDEIARSSEDFFVCNGRQTGKSFAASIALIAHVLSNTEGLAVCISPTQRQSNLILKTCKKIYSKIPPLGRPRILKNTESEMKLSNGSAVMALPSGTIGNGANLRGLSPTFLIIEEAAFLGDALYFDVVRPMRSVTRARMLVITSPNSCQGFAYDLYCSGTLKIIEVPSSECPRISKRFLEHEQKIMPKSAYLREYCCRWIALGAGVFDVDAIQRAFVKLDNPLRGGFNARDFNTN